jgi:phosphotriesterase-related protein
MHEHVFVITTEVQQNHDEWDEEQQVADAVEKLTALAAQGVRTIVDPTVIGLGRYIPRIVRINQQVPQLNIVAATGCYTYSDVPWFFHLRGPGLGEALGVEIPDPMVDMFVKDIREGIGETGVRAAFLKCAIDTKGLTSGVERIMRAVAKASLETGAPITVHTHPESESGLEVKRVMCDEEGVEPEKIVLGHSGDSADVDHLSALAEAGFVLGMDRFGIHAGTSFETRCDTVVELCRRGFTRSMVLSHDASCYIDWIDPAALQLMPQWHYLHIHDDVLPYLREHGVTEEQIDQMLVENPKRYFGG